MPTVICTETGYKCVYTSKTYDTMCMYDAITFKHSGQSSTVATIATEEEAEWWNEYERVMDNCQTVLDDRGLDLSDVAYDLGLDFSDLGTDMDKIAEFLGVRTMFEEEQA